MAAMGTGEIARWSARRPWLVVGAWLVLVFVAVGITAWGLSGVLTNEQSLTSKPESVQAEEAIRASGLPGRDVKMPVTEIVIVRNAQRTVDDAAFVQFGTTLLNDLRGMNGDIRQATGYFDAQNPAAPFYVSQDRHTVLLPTVLAGDVSASEEHVQPLLALVEERNGNDGFEVYTFGLASVNDAFQGVAEHDLQQAEQRGFPVALVILVVVFGAVVAALVPIVLAVLAILVTLGATTIVGQFWSLSFFVTNMIFMIGLAVGIDYCLFIIERFREERRRGLEKLDAITAAGNTASRAVLFSGITVVIALLGMFIVPSNIFRSLGTGAILVVLAALGMTLTLLPAVLSLLGDRINKLSIPVLSRRRPIEDEGGFWAGAAHAVMARPWLSLIASTVLLLALAAPYFSIKLGLAGAESLPRSTQVYEANRILATQFSQGLAQPTEVVITAANVNAPEVQAALQQIVATLANDQRFSNPQVQVNQRGDLALLTVAIAGEYSGEEALNAVRDLRSSIIPDALRGSDASSLDVDARVGGASALTLDFFDVVDQFTPIVFAFVLSLSFVLLMMVFRSIIVPLKAILMNLLSVGAAYGALVLVFQRGWGTDLLGFQRAPVIEAWLPLFLFTILFGLSMDYHVFLLSRIRERFDQTRDNKASVAFGLRSTANIITGAALIMVAVFSSFALGEMVMFQQIGFGLGIAVLLDATVVRMVLVPSAMELLGDRNWYLPRWLHWVPDFRVEGGSAHAAPQAAPSAQRVPVGARD
jgi:putative drug exporter of the RND superfamily